MNKAFGKNGVGPFVAGTISAVALMAALLLAASFIMTKSDLGNAVVNIITTFILGAGGTLGSFVASKRLGKNGLRTGMIMGGCIFSFFTVVGVILGGTFSSLSLIRFLVIMLSSSIGGVLGVNIFIKRKMI